MEYHQRKIEPPRDPVDELKKTKMAHLGVTQQEDVLKRMKEQSERRRSQMENRIEGVSGEEVEEVEENPASPLFDAETRNEPPEFSLN